MPVVHVRLQRQRGAPRGSPARLRRHRRRTRWASTPADVERRLTARTSALRPRALRRRRCRTWRRSSASPAAAACASSKTPPRGWAPRGGDGPSARSATPGASASTRPRTSPAAKAARWSWPTPRLARPGRDRTREGHEPRRLLPRRGGQVHLGGGRHQLRALGRARRDARRPARQVREDPGASSGGREALPRGARRLGGRARRAPRARAAGARSEPPHLLPPLPGGAAARRGAARVARAGDPGDVPLRPPALGAPRPRAGPGRRDAGHRPGGGHAPPPAPAPPARGGRGRPGRRAVRRTGSPS